MIAAGYLHDIGKPVAAQPRWKGRQPETSPSGEPYHTFSDHERIGERMVTKMEPSLFEQFALDQKKIAHLVGSHYLPMKGVKAMRSAYNFEEFREGYEYLKRILDIAPVSREEVLTMFIADKMAQGKFCTDKEWLMAVKDSLLGQGPDLEILYDMHKRTYVALNGDKNE